MRVGVVELFRKCVSASQYFRELSECPRLVIARRAAVGLLAVDQHLWRPRWNHEVQRFVLMNILGGRKPEHLVLLDRAAPRNVIIPAQQVRGWTGNVRGIQNVVAQKYRCKTVHIVAAGAREHVHDAARSMPELRLVAARNDLEL